MTADFLHQQLARGKWLELSLLEQFGNIGSEVSRAALAKKRGDEDGCRRAAWRAIDLFDLTLGDPRWRGRLGEIARAREVFCDAVWGVSEYATTLEDLDRYFFEFAHAAKIEKTD